MFEELRKKTFKASLAGSIILLLAGAFLSIFFVDEVFYATTGYVDFEELEPDEIKNQNVDFAMTANFGCYLEEYEYNEDTGRSTTTSLYYVVWTGDEYVTDFRYMTVKVPAKMEKAMEAMADNTFNDMYSDPINISGKIKKLSDEEYEYFVEYFAESGWTADEIAEGTLPYYIDCYNSKGSMIGTQVFLFLGGVLLLVWGICRIVKGSKGGYLKKLEKDYTAAGYTESTVASDFNHGFAMNKKANFKIGRLMIYYQSGSKFRAIPTNKIMWAYLNRVTHRTNGIKTGTTYNVIFVVEGVKNAYSIGVDNEQMALDILEKIDRMFPWVIVGYSDELKKMLAKDRAAFVALRYNTCEHVAVEPGFEAFQNQTVDTTDGATGA